MFSIIWCVIACQSFDSVRILLDLQKRWNIYLYHTFHVEFMQVQTKLYYKMPLIWQTFKSQPNVIILHSSCGNYGSINKILLCYTCYVEPMKAYIKHNYTTPFMWKLWKCQWNSIRVLCQMKSIVLGIHVTYKIFLKFLKF